MLFSRLCIVNENVEYNCKRVFLCVFAASTITITTDMSGSVYLLYP